jgi:hypothetical protein
MITAHRFTWDKYSSLDFDVTACVSFDGDTGDVETGLSREAVVSETYNGALKRGAFYKWNESFNVTITLVKNDFSDFTQEQNRRILKWITGRQTPGFLDIYKDDSNVIEYSVLGNFVNVSQRKLGNARIIGYVLEYESLTPYAYSRLNTVPENFVATDTLTMKNVSLPSNNTFMITIDTDEPEAAVYPKITIKHNGTNYVRIADGTVLNIHSEMIDNTDYFNGTTHYWKTPGSTKVNSTEKPNYDGWVVKEVDHAYGDNDTWEVGYIYQYGTNYYWLDPHTFHSSTTNPNLKTTSVKITNVYVDDNGVTRIAKCRVANNTLDETIILDGANKVVASSRVSRIFGDDFIDWDFLPLYDGRNQITIEGNCSVGIEYREVRKVGSY